jgi:hypothetical protein
MFNTRQKEAWLQALRAANTICRRFMSNESHFIIGPSRSKVQFDRFCHQCLVDQGLVMIMI